MFDFSFLSLNYRNRRFGTLGFYNYKDSLFMGVIGAFGFKSEHIISTLTFALSLLIESMHDTDICLVAMGRMLIGE